MKTIKNPVNLKFQKQKLNCHDSEDMDLKIMSGPHSENMWKAINEATTIKDLREALYLMGCKLQELEGKLTKI